MTITPSINSNSNGLFCTLRKKSSALKNSLQNRFSLSPGNHEAVASLNTTGTFRRSLSDVESSRFINGTKTLGRSRKFENSLNPTSVSALEEATRKFSDNGTDYEFTAFSENPKGNTSFFKTLKRNVSVRLLNSKKPEEINKRLEKAKELFQISEFKESKTLFESLLGSKHLDTPEKKSEISLYLAAIYLLEKDGSKASEYLKEVKDSFLKIVIDKHIQHLQSSSKDSPFPNVNCYEIETVSEYEQIITNKLFESFGKNTST